MLACGVNRSILYAMVIGKLCSDISLDMQNKDFVHASLSMKAEAHVSHNST